MQLVKTTFQDRISDIESYFELVSNIELAVGMGGAAFSVNGAPYQIKPEQQKIMYSGIYLHLYNLVEATISMLIEAVERHAAAGINGELKLLTEKMKKLYVKSIISPYDDSISGDSRLTNALKLFDQVLNIKPVEFKIPPGGGGNWDYNEIDRLSKSLGLNIKLPRGLNQMVNQPFRDDKGPIRLIKDIRNKLAHGAISFSECGENHVSSDFRKLIDIVKNYLTHVIQEYDDFITNHGYQKAQ